MLLRCKTPVWWLFWHRRPCICTTSAGCVESGHNHGEAEALKHPRKALYVCICGFCNWAPPFWKLTHLTATVSGSLFWYLYVCVITRWCVWFMCYCETGASCWTRSPALAVSSITEASWLVAHKRRLDPTGPSCSAIQWFTTEGSSGVTLLLFSSFLGILNIHAGTDAQSIRKYAHTQVNTHNTVVVWSDKGVVTGGHRGCLALGGSGCFPFPAFVISVTVWFLHKRSNYRELFNHPHFYWAQGLLACSSGPHCQQQRATGVTEKVGGLTGREGVSFESSLRRLLCTLLRPSGQRQRGRLDQKTGWLARQRDRWT